MPKGQRGRASLACVCKPFAMVTRETSVSASSSTICSHFDALAFTLASHVCDESRSQKRMIFLSQRTSAKEANDIAEEADIYKT